MGPEISPNEWLNLTQSDLAAYVKDRHLAILMSVDGTRRHYLLSHRDLHGRITNFEDYARHSADAYVRLYDLLFSLGVETVMTPLFYPPNFLRSAGYLRASMEMTRPLLCLDPFRGM
jgi:hypothetical protein